MTIPYPLEILLEFGRLALWCWILCVLLMPVFLPASRARYSSDRLVYAWTGFAGILIAGVFVLTMLQLYDFIGLAIFLLLIPLMKVLIEGGEQDELDSYLRERENRFIVWQLRLIETLNAFYVRNKIKEFAEKTEEAGLDKFKSVNRLWAAAVFTVAAAAAFIRMVPVLWNASPLTRDWFYMVQRTKEIRLQQYFESVPDPSGTFALTSVFSMLTQSSPEMVLHLVGSVTAFFMTLIIYWAIRTIQNEREHSFGALFGAVVFALLSSSLLPISLVQQVEANSLLLGLTFCVPSILFYWRYVSTGEFSYGAYSILGSIATGLTNLYVFLMFLAPAFLLLGIKGIIQRRKLGFDIIISWLVLLLLMVPYAIVIFYNDISPIDFLQHQLIRPEVFHYSPSLIASFTTLLYLYAAAAGVLFVGYLVEYGIYRRFRQAEFMVSLTFLIMSSLYFPELGMQNAWIDLGQLDLVYAVAAPVICGLFISAAIRLIAWSSRLETAQRALCGGVLVMLVTGGLVYQTGGVKVKSEYPKTVPDGFFEAYYKIVDERMPYSYSIVAPSSHQTLATSRHYFMDYTYFLNQYSKVDSLYFKAREKTEEELTEEEKFILPAPSVFVFTEKPPYQDIQRGILSNPGEVMQEVHQWMSEYRVKENRKLYTYYETPNVKVYEIVNNEQNSRISDILNQVRPREEGILQ